MNDAKLPKMTLTIKNKLVGNLIFNTENEIKVGRVTLQGTRSTLNTKISLKGVLTHKQNLYICTKENTCPNKTKRMITI